MLFWNKELWLIDHGAALYFHHNWPSADTSPSLEEQAQRPFIQVKDHVLLPWASKLDEVDAPLRELLTPEHISNIVALIPDVWLDNWSSGQSPDEIRNVYTSFLNTRIGVSSIFVNQAQHARQTLI